MTHLTCCTLRTAAAASPLCRAKGPRASCTARTWPPGTVCD